MRTVPNDIVQTLLRCLPVITDQISRDVDRRNTKLCNAVRLTRNIIRRLQKIELEQSDKPP